MQIALGCSAQAKIRGVLILLGLILGGCKDPEREALRKYSAAISPAATATAHLRNVIDAHPSRSELLKTIVDTQIVLTDSTDVPLPAANVAALDLRARLERILDLNAKMSQEFATQVGSSNAGDIDKVEAVNEIIATDLLDCRGECQRFAEAFAKIKQ